MPDVQVRIAVAVDAEGHWYGSGEKGWDDDSAIGEVTGWVGTPCNVVWLTATLPVPEAVEVQAKVEEAQ